MKLTNLIVALFLFPVLAWSQTQVDYVTQVKNKPGYDPRAFPGVDACAKIQKAIDFAPSGAVVDAGGFLGSQGCSTTITINKPLHLKLGSATFAGAANPLLWIKSSNVKVTGVNGGSYTAPPAGTLFSPTSTNTAVYAGNRQIGTTDDGVNLFNVILRDFGVLAATGSAPSAGLYLSRVNMADVSSVNVNGKNLMQYGYLLEAVEQSEIHGGSIINDSLINVDWRKLQIGSQVSASCNGVNFHGNSLQNSTTNGVNIQFEPLACDDAQITQNHLVITLGALININVQQMRPDTGGMYIANNHIENYSVPPYALTNPANAWVVKVDSAANVTFEANLFDTGPSPFNNVWITGTSRGIRFVNGNTIAGVTKIDSGVYNTTFRGNFANSPATVTDLGVDTWWFDNRTINVADSVVASGFTGSNITTFKPKHNTDGTVAGSDWGIEIQGKPTSGVDSFVRFCTSPCLGVIAGDSNGGGHLYFRNKPRNAGGVQTLLDMDFTTNTSTWVGQQVYTGSQTFQGVNLFQHNATTFDTDAPVRLNGTINLGAGGSQLSKANFQIISVNSGTVSAASCTNYSGTFSSVPSGAVVTSVSPPADIGNLSLSVYPDPVNANQVILHFCNPTAANIDPPHGNYKFLVIN